MFNGGGEIPAAGRALKPTSTTSLTHQVRRQAQIRIIEQPASKALRFRYECEGRSAGSIPGVSSTSDNKTFPTIQIAGYQGKSVVVVSCVTKDPPYRPHPHNLVGREGCKKGVCTLEIPTDTMTVQFSNLGIQCVKKKDIEQALKVREEIRVDPFRTGFGHRSQPTAIDLNAVRLCFQVFLEGSTPGKFSIPLTPVVSDPIYDKKAMSDLSIFKLSHCTSPVDGGKADMILLCEKVAKEDIQVRFYEENGDWEAFADFQPTQVYKQHAIWFKTPKYKTVDIIEPVKVFIQLRRPSDGATSEPLPFELLPLDTEPGALKRKRQKIENPAQILRHLQEQDTTGHLAVGFKVDTIKDEPRDTSPSPYHGNLSPYSCGGTQYVPNISSSPTYMIESQYQPNITSSQYLAPNAAYGNNTQQQPWNKEISQMTPSNAQPEWNITLPGGAVIASSKPTTNNLNVNAQESLMLYNFDTRQVNSEEIRDLLITENTQLPEISGDNLFSFSDIQVQQDYNMMDSIERLANFRIDNIYLDGKSKDNT